MSIRNTIIVTLGTTLCFAACDANLGTSESVSLESAPLASDETIWDITVDVDAFADGVGQAPSLSLSVPVALSAERLAEVDLRNATLTLEDAETGDELAFSRMTYFGGRPAFDVLEVEIADPCAQKARCALAYRVVLQVNSPVEGVVATPSIDTFAQALSARVAQY